MYTLYTRAGSGGFVAEAALSMAGAPFKTVEVERGSTDAAFRGISPLGQVPVLTLPDGQLDHRVGGDLHPHRRSASRRRRLSPAPDSPDRPQFLRWMLFMSSVLYPALLRVFYARALLGLARRHRRGQAVRSGRDATAPSRSWIAALAGPRLAGRRSPIRSPTSIC